MKQTLEEITLGMLEQLGSTVRPARHVPNTEALKWALGTLASSEPPEELDMEWYSMGDAEATELAAALKSNTSVKVLKLRYNEIRDAGATALAGAIESHNTLETLTLGNNLIGSSGAEKLAASIASKGTLTSLDLRYNQIGPDLPAPFAKLHSLTTLDLRANRLISIPPSLGSLTNLKELVLERNHDLGPKAIAGPHVSTPELLELIRTQAPGGGAGA